jgi:tetratricopeptide (TPR) repeat protein
MKKFTTLKIAGLIIICLNLQFAHAQGSSPSIKIKIAQSYERAGDYGSAIKIYEEIFQKDSLNLTLFDALKRGYLQLKRYNDAVTLIKKWIRLQPRDISLLAQLGSVYVLASEESEANKIWEEAIRLEPNRESTYLLVGMAMVESRLFDRAVELYKRGRIECHNPNLFAIDIAYLYSLMLNYPEATKEYINLLRQNPSQLTFVQSRIGSYTERVEGLSATILVVSQAVKNEPTNVTLHQLLGWLYMEAKDFNRAYEIYKIIDSRLAGGGLVLFSFAERAFHEKSYDAATKAYNDIITGYPNFNQMAQVKFGLAHTLEESRTETDTVTIFGPNNPFNNATSNPATFADILEAYQNVISAYPNTEVAAQSNLRIGIIKQEKMNDLEGAGNSFEAITSLKGRFASIAWEAKIRLGKVNLMQGNLKSAEGEFRSLYGEQSATPVLRDEALFQLAQLSYFSENFQNALGILDTLTKNPQSDATNDALALKLFIQEQIKQNEKILKQYAKADLLKHQSKLSEALSSFESLLKNDSLSSIIENVYLNCGDILTSLHRYTEAVSAYDHIIINFPDGIYADQTLLKKGQIFELGLNDREKAVGTYQQLLEKYINSIYATEARKRIRGLRGDNI